MFFLRFDIRQSRKSGESALRWLARGVPGLGWRFQVSSRVWQQRQPLISKSEHNVPHYFIRPTEHYNYIYIAQFYFSSRDLHPVGWAERTGHPLQEPLTPEEVGWLSTIARLNTFPFQGWLVFNQVKYWASRGGCPTPGCRGLGHIRGAKYSRFVKVRLAFSLPCQICFWY